MTATSIAYRAVRITHDSVHGFAETRARFDELVPEYDNDVSIELVITGAGWPQVEAEVSERVGRHGLVALARLDQGALLSLDGETLEATLYLVGNPLVARQITHVDATGALYAPFRVAIYRDTAGVHISYDQPSSVFGSLGSADIDTIAGTLDDKILAAATAACAASS